jgi:hypothetical protein
MDLHDQEALTAAIAMMRADPEQRELLDHVLANQSEQEAGLWAVGSLQVKNLHLKGWEAPPYDTSNVKDPSDHYGCRPNEVALLRKMLSLGISRYDPDPLRAIERVERESAA